MRIFAITTANGEAVAYQDSCGAINTRTSLVVSKQLQDKQENMTRKQKKTYDHYHRARPLGILQPGDSVWGQDAKTSGTVIRHTDSARSYLVRTPTSCLRRNRRHLAPTPSEQLVSPSVRARAANTDVRCRQRNSRNRCHQL